MMLGDWGGVAGASEVEEEQAERASRRMGRKDCAIFMRKKYAFVSLRGIIISRRDQSLFAPDEAEHRNPGSKKRCPLGGA